MSRLRVTASVDQAAALLERYAALSGELAVVQGNREVALSAANAVADRLALPLVDELEDIRGQLEPWWTRHAADLTKGKRKSIELGGCTIGSRAGRSSLAFAGGDEAAVAVLQAYKWAQPYLRVTVSPDRAAISRGLAGKHAPGLKALGFSVADGATTFVLERVAPPATVEIGIGHNGGPPLTD